MPFGKPVLDTVTTQPRERESDVGVNPSGMAEMRRETGSGGGGRELIVEGAESYSIRNWEDES